MSERQSLLQEYVHRFGNWDLRPRGDSVHINGENALENALSEGEDGVMSLKEQEAVDQNALENVRALLTAKL